jgi:hypothetical protein
MMRDWKTPLAILYGPHGGRTGNRDLGRKFAAVRYTFRGKQYIAVVAGQNLIAFKLL